MFACVAILIAIILTAILTYISVIERKREIGLLRSLGARKLDVSLMFVIESAIVGLVGGILSVALTYILSPITAKITVSLVALGDSSLGTPTVADLSKIGFYIIPLLLVASVIIGVISSLIPAIIAGNKKPADILKE